MGSALSLNSDAVLQNTTPKLIGPQDFGEDSDCSVILEDFPLDNIGEQQCFHRDASLTKFINSFHKLHVKKEEIQHKLHEVVLEWRQNAIVGAPHQEHSQQVHCLIKEFTALHEELDDILEKEKHKLEDILPKRNSMTATRRTGSTGSKNTGSEETGSEEAGNGNTGSQSIGNPENDSLELEPEVMERLMYFQRFNEQHINILTFVLSDIQECKGFLARNDAITGSCSSFASDKKRMKNAVTVSVIDAEETEKK